MKEKILEAACQEFIAKGFEGASTTAIAKTCGVTQPLIYHYFRNKLRLYVQCFKYLGDFKKPDPKQRMVKLLLIEILNGSPRINNIKGTCKWIVSAKEATERKLNKEFWL